MKRIVVIVCCFSLLAALAGCATSSRQPSMKAARIQPDHLQPGDTAIITVEVADRFDVVQRVEGLVMEDRTITFKLRDDGITPDKEAGDDTWTIQVDVPFNAPPGDFEFEVVGYNSEGEVIVVHDENDEAAPLSISFVLVIEFPEEE